MKTIKFLTPLLEHSCSVITDISNKKTYTYLEFYNQVDRISKELYLYKIPQKSIIVIYKIRHSIDSLLLLFACINNKLIPFIVENEKIENLVDIRYSVILTNENITVNNFNSSQLETIPNTNLLLSTEQDKYLGKENELIIVTSSKSTSTTSKKILLGEKETLFNIYSNKNSLPITVRDTTLILLPLSYSYGLIAQLFTHLFIGANIILASPIIGVMQLKNILQDYEVTNIFFTPLIARLARIYNIENIKNKLSFITLGGDKPSPSTIQAIYELLKCPIYGTYGLAEAGPRVSTSKIDIQNPNIDLGEINDGIQVSIIKSNKYKLLSCCNDIGFLKIKTPSIFLGYVEGNKLYEPQLKDSIVTKDIVYYRDRKYYLLGRDDEYFRTSSKLYWFQDFKNFFYNNQNVLKVKIKKDDTDKLLITIYHKSINNEIFSMQNEFETYFRFDKETDYNIQVINYQYNQYK